MHVFIWVDQDWIRVMIFKPIVDQDWTQTKQFHSPLIFARYVTFSRLLLTSHCQPAVVLDLTEYGCVVFKICLNKGCTLKHLLITLILTN